MVTACHVSSIADLLRPEGKSPPRLRLPDVPEYVRDQIGLNALTLSADLLSGATPDDLAAFRDRADKAGCACLMLAEPEPQPFGSLEPDEVDAAIERTRRVVRAAQLLGCNAAGVRVAAPEDPEAEDRTADAVREVMRLAEKLELNVLLRPHDGLTATPESMTSLIKKIGGFRCGTMPDFQDAVATGDAETYLRRLTPYASCVLASTLEFSIQEPGEDDEDAKAEDAAADDDAKGGLERLAEAIMSVDAPEHTAYELAPLLAALGAVGFDGTLAIDYRGGGDGTLGVLHSKDAIDAAMDSLSE